MLELFVRRGRELEAADCLDEAKAAYRAALVRAPRDAEALGGLGRILYREGARRTARRLFERLVTLHPGDAAANTNLGILLLENDELETARAHFERALHIDPRQTLAHYGLSRIAAIEGDDDAALRHQQSALGTAPVRSRAASIASRRSPKVLLLGSERQLGAVDSASIAGSMLSLQTIVVERAPPSLPEHHVVFNTITDADRNADALSLAAAVVQRSTAPVINHPESVLRTGRTELPRTLQGIAGAVVPDVLALPRAELVRTDAARLLELRGFSWPLLLRAKGFHSGQHFVRVQHAESLREAVEGVPGEELLVIAYAGTRRDDGLYRKYRVMFVDGTLYPLHLAVSSDWKVHYFSSGMREVAAWRAEEMRFLQSMETEIGARAVRTLEEIGRRLALDYAGVDFALDARGDAIVFEANATMTVPLPPPGEMWDYRRSHVRRILDATRRMLFQRARAGGWR